MTIIIKSQNGRRSCMVSRGKPVDPVENLRRELTEALQGLTIKLDVKITSVLRTCDEDNLVDSDRESNDKSEEMNQIKLPTLNNIQQPKLEPELSDRPPLVDFQSAFRDQLICNGQSQACKQELKEQPASPYSTEVAPAARQPRKPCDIPFRPLEYLRQQTSSEPTRKPTVSKPVSDKVKPYRRPKVDKDPVARIETAKLSPRTERLRLITQIKARVDQETQPAKKSKFTQAEFKIGDIVKTIRTNLDATGTYVAHSGQELLDITQRICDMADMIENKPELFDLHVDDVVLAKSAEDDTWYRAIVTNVIGSSFEVYYLDWGLVEFLDITRFRSLDDKSLSTKVLPACAIKVTMTNVQEAPEDEDFQIRVDAFDEYQQTYLVSKV